MAATHPPTDGAAAAPHAEPGHAVDISLVIPVYDEEACVELLWERLRPVIDALGPRFEVLFVDDGSTDRSPVLLKAIRTTDPRVRLLTLDRHHGQSAALAAGFRAARGDRLITMDADLQNPPEEIRRLLEAGDDVDLVFGRRRKREDRPIKIFASRIGNGVRNMITGHRVHDTGCSLKLFRATALARIPMFNGMHRFLPTLFVFHGFAVKEILVDHHLRCGGASKYGLIDRAWRGLVDCLAVRWLGRRSLKYRILERNGTR